MANPVLQQRSKALSAGISLVKGLLQRSDLPAGFSTEGFTIQQLYRLAVKEPVPPNFPAYPLGRPSPRPPPPHKWKGNPAPLRPLPDTYPPHPDHPVRSIRFLKTEIMSALRQQRLVDIVTVPKSSAKMEEELATATTKKKQKKAKSTVQFVWKVVNPDDPKYKRQPTPNAPPEKRVPFGSEVGVGLDISHLNKRRKLSRTDKLHQSVLKMKGRLAKIQNQKPRKDGAGTRTSESLQRI